MSREGLDPTSADFDVYVRKAVDFYDRNPAYGTAYAARRVAVDVGLRGWATLASAVEEAVDGREA